jgi:hypothetical protein
MPSQPLDRTAAVSRLLAQLLGAAERPAESEWLRLVLRRGFIGFDNMTDAQLRRELELRELSVPALAEDEAFAEEDDERWGDAVVAIERDRGRRPDRDFD